LGLPEEDVRCLFTKVDRNEDGLLQIDEFYAFVALLKV
jgi:Ca2+-binding EF-hand superfamily protein